MDKQNELDFPEELTEAIRGHLRRQLQTGIAEGAYAICKTVLDIASDADKTAEERLGEIIKLCRPAVASHDRSLGDAKGS